MGCYKTVRAIAVGHEMPDICHFHTATFSLDGDELPDVRLPPSTDA